LPFAGYPDFAACVADNGDKSSPEGFCAWLEHNVTGAWPGDMTAGLPDETAKIFWAAFGDTHDKTAIDRASAAIADDFIRRNGTWVKVSKNAQLKTRRVEGVEIFATGTHNGDKYTVEDLDIMVSAFQSLKGRLDPPLKIGHTSDEFNLSLAKQMKIPVNLLTGDEGNGAMAFGWVSSLRREGKVLVADFADVPEAIANLIKSKSFNKVSSEVIFDYKDGKENYRRVLCGVALLGAQLPAVKEIKGLDKSAVFTQQMKGAKIIDYEAKGETEMKTVLKLLGLAEDTPEEKVFEAVKAKYDMMAEMAKLLGLPEIATPDEIMAKMKEAMAGAGEGAKMTKQFADIQTTVATLTAQVAQAKKEKRLLEFTAKAGEWKAIAGKPEDMAAELVALDEQNPKLAEAMVKRYEDMNKSLVAAGVLSLKGTVKGNDNGTSEAEKKIHEYEEKGLSHAKAVLKLADDNTTLFRQYQAENIIKGGDNDGE